MGAHHARAMDLPELSGILARSFFGDPLMGWMLPDPATRLEDLTAVFGICLAAAVRRGNTFRLADTPSTPVALGAAIWAPPDVEAMSDEEGAPIAPLVAERYGDDGLARLGAFGEVMAAHHPEESHFYLWIVGVEPGRQGQGLGEALLTPMLTRCDHDEMPAYLESSNPRNIGFYERLGFSTISEFHPEGGPLLTGMWRDPRPAS